MRNNAEPSTSDLALDETILQHLCDSITSDVASELYDGAVVLVAHHGRIVLHQAIGYSDREQQRPCKIDDVFHLMSITKQLSTVVILQAIERGYFSLSTKISEIIPEFGTKGKNNITVYHLLTHTSGMNPELPSALAPGDHINIKALVTAASQERLLHRPGRVVCYNPYSAHSILAEMVSRTDPQQRSFGEIMEQQLLTPLGMIDSTLSIRDDLKSRRVRITPSFNDAGIFDPEAFIAMNELVVEGAEFAAAGAIGTASDIYRFTEMLRQGGTLDGQRILSPAMIENALKNHTGNLPNDIFDYAREMREWPDWPAYIGLTFFLRGSGIFPTPMGHNTSPATFCGEGAGSTLFWVDPKRNLTFICLTAGIMDEADNILRFQRLSDIVVSALGMN